MGALAVLCKIAADEKAPASARIQAAQVILDRAFGKPVSSVDIRVEREPTEMSDAELASAIAQMSAVASVPASQAAAAN
jgi:hypothetical protein